MPGLIQQSPFKTITVKELHPTFGAEIEGVDFDNLSDEQFDEVKGALAKYGFAVFRNTSLTDDAHVAFSRRLGELDNIRRYITPGRTLRYANLELFDASNLDGEGEIVPSDSPRAHYNKGNAMFHVDSSFNPRRASYSALRAVQIPPPGQGGETEFADSRTAWDDLDEATKNLLLYSRTSPSPPSPSSSETARPTPKPLIGAHSLNHSRKTGSPLFFADLDVEATAPQMARHRLAQVHEPSGRMNLYIGAHLHHIVDDDDDDDDGIPACKDDEVRKDDAYGKDDEVRKDDAYGKDNEVSKDTKNNTNHDTEEATKRTTRSEPSTALIHRLNAHATHPRYVTAVRWQHPGDLIIWDNRAVLHRATGGAFEDRHKRDMRRTTVHDDGAYAWGENRVGERMPGFDSYSKPLAKSVASVPVTE